MTTMTDRQLLTAVDGLKRESARLGREIIDHGQKLLAATATFHQEYKAGIQVGLPLELKRAPGTASTKISGYASVWNTVDLGGDIVLPGAFSDTLAKHKRDGTGIVMLWAHNMDEPIGIWEKFTEDPRGLYVEGRLLPSVRRAAEAAELIEAGAINGLSIGYKVME